MRTRNCSEASKTKKNAAFCTVSWVEIAFIPHTAKHNAFDFILEKNIMERQCRHINWISPPRLKKDHSADFSDEL